MLGEDEAESSEALQLVGDGMDKDAVNGGAKEKAKDVQGRTSF